MELKSLAVRLWFGCGIVWAQNASSPEVPSKPTNGTSSMFPPCALECISNEVVKSPCRTVANETCVCNNQGFYKQVETCVMASCSPPDGIATQKAKADFCHDPVRSQVTKLYGLRSLEVAAWFLVLFRFYARWVTQKFFGRDDYVMMVVAVIYVPQLIISQLMDDNAFGRDIWNLEWDKIMLGLKLFYVQEPLYFMQLALTKISILFLYLRIFPGRRFSIITYTFMAFVGGSSAVLVGASIFECLPVGYFWEGWRTEYLVHSKKCLNLTLGIFGSAGLSILQDLIMIILPIPPLLKTRLPIKDKIGIAGLFVLGLLITAASCFRLQFINVAYSPNPFWDYEPALLWSLVELAMSFLVTSLPAINNYHTRIAKPKLRAYLESRRTTEDSQETATTGEGRRRGRSNLRTMLSRRAAKWGNNNLILTLAFTRMSWNSLTDRKKHSHSGDGEASPMDRAEIGPKTAPQISLKGIENSPSSGSLADDEHRVSSTTGHRDSIQEELETAHAMAWVGRAEVSRLEPNNKGNGASSTPTNWPLSGSMV